jgi:hypothetical protein
MTGSLTRTSWLVAAVFLLGACGSGVEPEPEASLETGEPQALGVCNYPLCSSICTCAASCSQPCCVTTAGPQVSCYNQIYNCSAKVACTCGNGVCDGAENSKNCYKDCPECVNPGTSATSCGYSCNKPAATEDRDADGIPDQLEYLLAHKFFPDLKAVYPVSDQQQFYLRGPSINSTVPYSAHFPRIAFKTGPCSASRDACIEIIYGMAYHFDCGAWPNNTCSGLNAHLGDSEFYIVVARRTTAWTTAKTRPVDWQLIGDFTSAHYLGDSGLCSADSSAIVRYGIPGKDCRSVYGSDAARCTADWECRMNYMSTPHCENVCSSWPGSALATSRATIYVSQGKHAMYHSVSSCESGACLNSDHCNANTGIDLRSGKTCFNLQNVGNSSANTAFRQVIRKPNTLSDTYNVWTEEAKFGAASPYKRPFGSVVGWCML